MAKVKSPKKPAPKKDDKGKGGADARPPAKTKAEKKKDEIDYKSPEYLARYDGETLAAINDAEAEESLAESIFKRRQEDAKDAKAEYETARKRVRRLIGDRRQGRGKPPYDLFSQDIVAQTMAHPPVGSNGAPSKSSTEPGANPPGSSGWYPVDLWKAYPIDRLAVLGLTPSDAEKLKAGKIKDRPEPYPITTMGELAAFSDPSASGYSRKLTDISGIGAAAAERVENASTAFWAQWPTLADAFAVEKGHKRPDSQDEADAAKSKKGKADADGKKLKPRSRSGGKPSGNGDGKGGGVGVGAADPAAPASEPLEEAVP